jgi:hypothetical protein
MKYAAMSAGILDAAIKSLKLKAPTQKTIPAKAKVIQAHFSALAKKSKEAADNLSVCTNCGGECDFGLEACPYCGDSETATAENAITTTGTSVANAEPADTEALDEAVRTFKAKKKNAEVSIWELGQEVLRIHDGDLWKTRLLGKDPQYKTFKAFCAAELGVSHTHAYNLMEVAKKFSREEVEKVGVARLSIIAQLPPEQREQALNQAAAGEKSKRQLEADKAASKGNKVQETVTIMARAGSRVKVPMIDGKGQPAKALADEPWCEEIHENGVVSRYVVKADPKTGQLLLVITRRRE